MLLGAVLHKVGHHDVGHHVAVLTGKTGEPEAELSATKSSLLSTSFPEHNERY
jgi:hypothetical protein